MPIASIRRRIGKLEIDPMFVIPVDYPPFTSEEIVATELRLKQGKRFSREEMGRLRSQSPIVDGALMIVASRKSISAKSYGDVDLSEI
jgi:hypothetical protein